MYNPHTESVRCIRIPDTAKIVNRSTQFVHEQQKMSYFAHINIQIAYTQNIRGPSQQNNSKVIKIKLLCYE